MIKHPIRRWLVVTTAASAALLVAGVLDVAGADTSPTTPRSVEVKGTGLRDVSFKAGDTAIAAAYRDALASAIATARGKADFIAGQLGVSITGVHNLSEQSGTDDSQCDDGSYYGSTVTGTGGAGSAPSSAPALPRRRRHGNGGRPGAPGRTGTSARAARAPQCWVQADVTVDYTLS
jgi:hypothetical protein